MIILVIVLYALIAICVGYGYIIAKYKKYYKDKYSFSESLKYLDADIAIAIPMSIFFPITLAVYICYLIGRLITKLIDKFV